MSKDRRLYGRVKTERKTSCLINEAGKANPIEVEVKDISPGGICVIIDREISEDAPLQVQVNFTTFNLGDTPTVTGKVVHCYKDKETKKYVVGVSYTRGSKSKV